MVTDYEVRMGRALSRRDRSPLGSPQPAQIVVVIRTVERRCITACVLLEAEVVKSEGLKWIELICLVLRGESLEGKFTLAGCRGTGGG